MYKYKMFCNVICMNTTYIFLEGYYIPIPHPHLSSQVPNAAEGMQPSVLAWIKPSPGPQVSLSTAHSPTLTTGSTCLGEAEGQNLWSAEDLPSGYVKIAIENDHL